MWLLWSPVPLSSPLSQSACRGHGNLDALGRSEASLPSGPQWRSKRAFASQRAHPIIQGRTWANRNIKHKSIPSRPLSSSLFFSYLPSLSSRHRASCLSFSKPQSPFKGNHCSFHFALFITFGLPTVPWKPPIITTLEPGASICDKTCRPRNYTIVRSRQ